VAVIGFTGWYVLNRKTDTTQQKTNSSSSSSSSEQTSQVRAEGNYSLFEGTLKHINNGCAADGTCSMTVDDKVIITGGGLGPSQEENTWGITEADFHLGDKVTVKALKDGDNYTLHRCAECYIKRVNPRW